ncbi:MAG: amino acid adenylation domain-containing protein [Lachnospiraceae bacterium]|nr:amino acid adenylation domain-containing protein [Lachnospiraceae bacterium]
MVTNVFQYLEASAGRYPDKIAFEDAERSVTFRELREKAYAIADRIHEKCGGIRNEPIGVYMYKGVDCLIAFMGIVCSGNFYSPIDRHSPKARIDRIMETLSPKAILYNEEPYEGREDLCIDIREVGTSRQEHRYYEDNIDTDPLYVLFTSGSTGQPKGVTISHRGVIDYAEWLYDTFAFDEETVFGNQAPFYFDNSILDIYSTLRNGATTCLIPERSFTFQRDLFAFLKEHRINTIFWVPSALIGVANSGILDKEVLPALDKILFCGEVMPNRQLNAWRKHYPDALFANLYGPTEITDVCTCFIVDREFQDDEPLPIGFPCRNTDIIVLNDRDERVTAPGDKGELCVRGTCLSMGYFKDFEKTDRAFVQNPLNPYIHETIYHTGDIVEYNERGELMYLSRKDFQIKHQGHRIELGEIDTAGSSIAGVNCCCALYDDVNRQIVLFYTASDAEITDKAVYRELKSRIPGYMLPSRINRLADMPLNLNGKIDRVALKEQMKE